MEESQISKYDFIKDFISRSVNDTSEITINYGKKGRGISLEDGMVLAIEPMVNIGSEAVFQTKDGWTIETKDGLPSAHFEYTIAIKKDKTEILSSFNLIEDILN